MAERRSVSHLGPHTDARAYSKGRRGGKEESVEKFVLEAYEANVVLKLYEAATAKAAHVPSIARYMPETRNFAGYLSAADTMRRPILTERDIYSRDFDSVKEWALTVVREAVNRKVEQDVYPILLGEALSYKPA